MRSNGLHRYRLTLWVLVAVLLAALATLPTDRHALAWLYMECPGPLQNVRHIHIFPLDRLDPTCPQCM